MGLLKLIAFALHHDINQILWMALVSSIDVFSELTLFAAQIQNISDQPQKSNIDADIVPRKDARISTLLETRCSHQTSMQTNEEYKDSLEFDAVNEASNRINDDDNEGDLLDTVEQDSLETAKIVSTQIGSSDGATQFLPFAHIGTSWSNECAAQNSTAQLNSNTNQKVEIESTNQTNETDVQTNNSITTKQTIEHDFEDLPGTKL